jgi:hypothetical protein
MENTRKSLGLTLRKLSFWLARGISLRLPAIWNWSCAALTCACLLFFPLNAIGQLSSTGTIRGSVRDTSGAAVPEATVSVESEGTHTISPGKTSQDGEFTISGLQPGMYLVRVESRGFQDYVITHLEVHPAQTAEVSAILAVGATSSQVTVAANAAQVQTSTPEVSSELSERQVSTLPMNGRNYQTLAALMPGAVNTSSGNQMGQGGFKTSNVMSVNGMGLSGTFYTVDGIWNENTGNFTQTSVTPSPDSIQEVRLLQNNYSAQYNLMGANVIVVQTKSGEGTFHGSAYEFFRNDALNTKNYFSQNVPTLRQNIYGYTLGGPFFIPHIYNTSKQKTFFFGSQQWSPVHSGSVIRGTTASAQQRAGDFSATTTSIIDPLTKKPFPGNIIPASRLSAQAVALINATAPLPNNPGGGFLNYLNVDSEINSQRDDLIKVDHNFTPKYRLTYEYIGETAKTLYANNASDGSPFNSNKQNADWSDYLTQVQFSATVTPSMINQFSVAMNHRVISLTQQGTTLLSQVAGYTQSVPYSGGLGTDRLPQINFSGGWSTFGAASGLPLFRNSTLDLTFSDDWSWSRGKHYLQIGVNDYYGSKRQTNISPSNGVWTFTGVSTGNPMADYLLGYAATLTQANTSVRPFMYFPAASPYIQDTWKVSSKLTLSGGVRYLWLPAPHATKGTETIFSPANYSASKAPIVNANGTITATPNYSPTNGLVYNGLDGTPLNYSTLHAHYFAPTFGFAYDIRGDGTSSLRGGYGIAYTRVPTAYDCTLSCANNPPTVQSLTLTNPNFPNAVGAQQKPAGAPTLASQDQALQASQIQSFSLSFQHQFRSNWLLSIAGAGNIARHLPATLNLNQPLPAGGYDYSPIINTGTISTAVYAPYQGYGAINTKTSHGVAYWDALEVSLGHSAGRSLFVSTAYTWQHDLANVTGNAIFSGNSTSQDAYNLRTNYGNSQLNIPHVFAASVIWTLPTLQKSAWLTRALIGGWQYSDITTVQSGFSLDPAISTSTRGLATRPNVTGQSIKGAKSVTAWFNPSAFTQPAAGRFGNAAPGSIQGPGTIIFDMSLYKTFHFTERHTVEFRSELFNTFNHTNFSAVSTSLGSGNYGQVTSAKDPRIAEFALKYRF